MADEDAVKIIRPVTLPPFAPIFHLLMHRMLKMLCDIPRFEYAALRLQPWECDAQEPDLVTLVCSTLQEVKLLLAFMQDLILQTTACVCSPACH